MDGYETGRGGIEPITNSKGAERMSVNSMPQPADVDRVVKQYKLKDDGLTKATADWWQLRTSNPPDKFQKLLAQLPKIQKLATDMKNSKEAVAAGPKAVGYFSDFIAYLPKEKQFWEKEVKRLDDIRRAPMQYIPDDDYVERVINLEKLRDNGLKAAITGFLSHRDDEFDQKLAVLSKILNLATEMKNSKEARASQAAEEFLSKIIAVVPKVKKEIENEKADFMKNGMHQVGVQFIITDWDGGKMSSDYVALIIFRAPGTPDVTNTEPISDGQVQFDNLHLKSKGTVSLKVRRPSSTLAHCEGVATYEFKPGNQDMQFKAIQFKKTVKVSAKSIEEATKKVGVKGEVGFEFEVVKVGGEVSEENEYKQGFEKEVEWEIDLGVPTFGPDNFKQTA